MSTIELLLLVFSIICFCCIVLLFIIVYNQDRKIEKIIENQTKSDEEFLKLKDEINEKNNVPDFIKLNERL